MSLIKVERYKHEKDWTIGRVYVKGKLFCYSVEDEKRDIKVKGETRIPEGTYKLGLRYSPKFSVKYHHDMIWVKDVPGFEFILIHPGNTDNDTEGCLLVGNKLGIVEGQEAVLNSVLTYKSLYESVFDDIKKGGQTITYTSI